MGGIQTLSYDFLLFTTAIKIYAVNANIEK